MSEDSMSRVEAVNKIDKIDGSQQIDSVEGNSRIAPNKEKFDAALQMPTESQGQQIAIAQDPGKREARTSLMDEVRKMHSSTEHSGKVTRESLVAQVEQLTNKIEGVRETLSTPDVSIKNSSQQLLTSKLTHINENLKIALSKAGVEAPSATSAVDGMQMQNPKEAGNPVMRFLGFLSDGESQLRTLGDDLQSMAVNNKEISPVNMLAVQVKMGHIQQELELFTALLSKSLESIKTIMNIQV